MTTIIIGETTFDGEPDTIAGCDELLAALHAALLARISGGLPTSISRVGGGSLGLESAEAIESLIRSVQVRRRHLVAIAISGRSDGISFAQIEFGAGT